MSLFISLNMICSLASICVRSVSFYLDYIRNNANFIYSFLFQGACIPQCSNGTNLLIPLSGKIDPEDFAITGTSTRFLVEENPYLPLLYDFEELEGELNFLTRVVALTFYPAVPGRIPITLGEVLH